MEVKLTPLTCFFEISFSALVFLLTTLFHSLAQ